MALTKRNYVANLTTITATNLNDIQDAVQTLEASVASSEQTFQIIANKTTSLNSSSTDTQYPSAKAVWDMGLTITQEAQQYVDEKLASMDATEVAY